MELDHILHPSHKLTYNKSVEKDIKREVCAACSDKISSDHYSCAECNFFLHILCAQLPSELTHSLHPLHPLRLLQNSPRSGDAVCNSCDKKIEGLVYHCGICFFDLDLICAFPHGLELNHVGHPHVLTYNKIKKKAEVVCAACLKKISAEHYSCGECKFFLHEFCAQQPFELTHELHQIHPLRLSQNSPYEIDYCNSCKIVNFERKSEGFFYHCDICSFNLDFLCAVLKPENHVCHLRHVLTYEKVVKKADKGMTCAACLEEISGPLAGYYSCRECNFFLHELCSRRPVTLTSYLHHWHPLRLVSQNPYSPGTACCCGCRKLVKGFVYDCLYCDGVVLGFKCAFPNLKNRIELLDLHPHPLTFQPRHAKFSCDICYSTGGEGDKEEQSFSCSICDFYIHLSCAFTALAKVYQGHRHELNFVRGVPKDLQMYDDLSCKVCHFMIFPEDGVFHCACCRYFIHFRCMMTHDTYLTSSIKDAVDYLDDSFFKHLFMDELLILQWPPRDISSELIRPLLLGKNGIVIDGQPKIRHFSHEQHDMILFEEQAVNNDTFFEEEDEEILCDACIHPINAPYYCCHECNYFLHLACANLPSYIKHFSHSHELELEYHGKFYNVFWCDRCQQFCNGLRYCCKTCDFALDLTCAALPAFIMHETHEHPLFSMAPENEARCYACGGFDADHIIFKCTICDVYLHHNCAMGSRCIRHRWDRDHPLLLRFPPHEDHPDHFMCDMCEKLIHPMRWLYSCFECEISFHTRCAPRYEKSHNIKYGGKVEISFHQHILQYLRKATLRNTCGKCEGKLDADRVFECETCYDCFCYSCVTSELLC